MRELSRRKDAQTGEHNGYIMLWNEQPSGVAFKLPDEFKARYSLRAGSAGLAIRPAPGFILIIK